MRRGRPGRCYDADDGSGGGSSSQDQWDDQPTSSHAGQEPEEGSSCDSTDYGRLMSPRPSTSGVYPSAGGYGSPAPSGSEAEPHRWPMLSGGRSRGGSPSASDLLCPSGLHPMPLSPMPGPSGVQDLAQPDYQGDPAGVLLRPAAGDSYLVSSSTGQLECPGSVRSDAPPPTPGMSAMVDSTVDDPEPLDPGLPGSESEPEPDEGISSSSGLGLASDPGPSGSGQRSLQPPIDDAQIIQSVQQSYVTEESHLDPTLVIYDYVLEEVPSEQQQQEEDSSDAPQLAPDEPGLRQEAVLAAVVEDEERLAPAEREALRRERAESRPERRRLPPPPLSQHPAAQRHQQQQQEQREQRRRLEQRRLRRRDQHPALLGMEPDRSGALLLERETEDGLLDVEREGEEGFLEMEREAREEGLLEIEREAADDGLLEVDRDPEDGLIEVGSNVEEGLLEVDRDAEEGLLEVDRDAEEGLLEVDRDAEEGLLEVDRDAEEGLLEMECGEEDALLSLDGRGRLFERDAALDGVEDSDGERHGGLLTEPRTYRAETDDSHPQPHHTDGRRVRRLAPADLSQLPVIYLSDGGLDMALPEPEPEPEPHLLVQTPPTDERPQQHQNDFWCEECCTYYRGRCPDHQVRLISDRPMQSRAWASLPTGYLTIRAVSPHHPDSQTETVYGVTAKKTIPKRTQFGPVEGIVLRRERTGSSGSCNPAQNPTGLVLSVDHGGHLYTVDVSNPDCSNWMRFVRRAETAEQQNVVLNQQGGHLFFISSRLIQPREELRAGYSLPYAARRGLAMLVKRETHGDAAEESRSGQLCQECGGDETGLCTCPAGGGGGRSHRTRRLPRRYRQHDNPDDPDERPPTCESCERCFVTLSALERHECDAAAGARSGRSRQRTAARQPTEPARRSAARWHCQYCPLHFESASTLNLHTLAHAAQDLEDSSLAAGEDEEEEDELGIPPDQPLDCPECKKEFLVKEDLICHVASHGTEREPAPAAAPEPDPRPYKCTPCGRTFAHEEWLKRHLLSHVPDEEKPLSCATCGRRFNTASALSCHRRSHLAAARKFQCPLCRQNFEQITSLREHVRMHAVNGKYTCPHCEKSFDGYMVIRKHIRSFHNDRVFVCSLCYKPCQSTDKLRLHMLKHSDHREFLCSECGKQFKRKDKLKEHVKRLHSAERKAAQERALRHQKQQQAAQHSPAKVPPTDYHRFIYKCHKCKLGFKRRGMLVNHLAKRHPGMGPEQVPELMLPILKTTKDFYCQYCDKTYKSSSKRKAHILKNHPGSELPVSTRNVTPGENVDQTSYSQAVGSVTMSPHGCQWCHKQYASRAKLLQHQRKKHRELMSPESQLPRAVVRTAAAAAADRHITVELDSSTSEETSLSACAGGPSVASDLAGSGHSVVVQAAHPTLQLQQPTQLQLDQGDLLCMGPAGMELHSLDYRLCPPVSAAAAAAAAAGSGELCRVWTVHNPR